MWKVDVIGKYMKIKVLISFLVIVLTFPSIGQWLNIKIGETVYWWATNCLLLFSFIAYKIKYNKYIPKLPIQIKLFMVYVILSAVYGCFMAESYWDWKLLINNFMIYLMPMCFYYVSISANLPIIIRRWCKFAIVAFWLLLPIMQFEAPGKFMIPFSFLIIFWPFIKGKWRYIIFFFFLTIFIFGTLGARSSVIRYLVCAVFSICFIYPQIFKKKVLKSISFIFLLSPIILFILGVTNVFNVFKIDEYLDINENEYEVQNAYGEKGEKESLTADTRTFLYLETLSSSLNHNYFIQGHSLARGYESPWFRSTDLTSYSRGERDASEVSILNIYTYMGIIGVILYFMIFLGAVAYVFKYSQNYMMYVIACIVAFRWSFAWLEDFTRFDLNNLFLWIMISMCYSPYFLKMNNNQFRLWIKTLLYN